MRNILSLTAFCVLAFGALTACQNSAPTQKVEQAKTNTGSAPVKDEHGADDAPRISLEEAKKEFDSQNIIFVDTRDASAFQQEHIKGAINIPAETFEQRFKEIPAGKKIVAYCS